MDQMIDKATISIQQTGLYELAILEWNGIDPVNKDWPNLKSHFGEAYNVRRTKNFCFLQANNSWSKYGKVTTIPKLRK